MTFKELSFELNPFSSLYKKYVFNNLIFYYSKTITNEVDLLLKKNEPIDFDNVKFFKNYNKVILENYPLEYITHKKNFYGYDFYIKKGVLVPRQETEYIISWIIENKLLDDKKTVIDLCTGSGAIANVISLLKPNLKVYGIEKYKTPYSVALKNKKIHNTNVDFICSDIFDLSNNFYNKADFVICNPPYIDKNDKNVDLSTKFEPKKALFAKEKGYFFYHYFFKEIVKYFHSNTTFVFEIGFNMKKKLEEFLKLNQNLKTFSFHKDLDNNYRILFAIKK